VEGKIPQNIEEESGVWFSVLESFCEISKLGEKLEELLQRVNSQTDLRIFLLFSFPIVKE
jgi:hypothetical protein